MKRPPTPAQQRSLDKDAEAYAESNDRLAHILGIDGEDLSFLDAVATPEPPAKPKPPAAKPRLSEAAARERKATLLADVLFEHGIRPENVSIITTGFWLKISQIASERAEDKVHPPHSKTTVDRIAELLKERYATRSID
jgi:hypothetical protein